MTKRIRGAVLSLGLVLAAAVPDAPARAAETLQLTVPEARLMARDAYRNGDFALAYGLARGLLERDPNDPAALLVIAATSTALGRPAEARRAGRLAFRLAPNQGMKFEAARFTSGAALAEGRFGLAQYWLRRASDYAPTPERAERTLREFRAVRSRNPVRLSFSFSVAPSSNLNNGADSPYLIIGGVPWIGELDGAAQALSGLRATAGLRAMYRLPGSGARLTEIGAQVFATANWLSDEAKAQAGSLKGSDLNYMLAEAIVRHSFRFGEGGPPVSVTFGAGKSWYGAEPYADQLRLSLERGQMLTPQTRLDLGLAGDWQWPEADDRVAAYAVSADLTRALDGGDQISLGVALRTTGSADINSEYRQASLRLGYDFAQPIGPVTLSAHLGASVKDFDAYSLGFFLVPGGRQDRSIEIGLEAVMTDATIAGFAPVLSLEGRKTRSNISRFEGDEFGVSVGFRSLF